MKNVSLSSSSLSSSSVDATVIAIEVDREAQVYENLLRKARSQGKDTTLATLRLAAKRTVEQERFENAIASGNNKTIHDAPREYWQALTAETIAVRWSLNPWTLFCWAERHGVHLLTVNARGRLCQENAWVWRDFYEDLPLKIK